MTAKSAVSNLPLGWSVFLHAGVCDHMCHSNSYTNVLFVNKSQGKIQDVTQCCLHVPRSEGWMLVPGLILVIGPSTSTFISAVLYPAEQ